MTSVQKIVTESLVYKKSKAIVFLRAAKKFFTANVFKSKPLISCRLLKMTYGESPELLLHENWSNCRVKSSWHLHLYLFPTWSHICEHVPQDLHACSELHWSSSGFKKRCNGHEHTNPSGELWQKCEHSELWSQIFSLHRCPSSVPSEQSFVPSHNCSTRIQCPVGRHKRSGCTQSSVSLYVGRWFIVVQLCSSDLSKQSSSPSQIREL